MRVSCVLFGAALTSACGGVGSGIESEGNIDGRWTVDHATTDGVLLGVWGASPEDVWAVGGQQDRSLVLHGDGTSWTRMAVPSTSLLFSVYGFSDSDVYAVGERGLILHYDGTTWDTVQSETQLPLFGLWGASGDDVWIVGGDIAGSAVVLRGSRGAFARVAVPESLVPNAMFKVHGSARDDVMMVGTAGTVLRTNGTDWRRDAIPTIAPLFSTWGRDPADVYAVGGTDAGQILHFDGQRWSQVVEVPTGQGLRAVFTSADGPTIAVGPQFVFELGRDGSIVQDELPAVDPVPLLHGVWGDEHGTTYAVGGTLYDYPRSMSGVILSRR